LDKNTNNLFKNEESNFKVNMNKLNKTQNYSKFLNENLDNQTNNNLENKNIFQDKFAMFTKNIKTPLFINKKASKIDKNLKNEQERIHIDQKMKLPKLKKCNIYNT